METNKRPKPQIPAFELSLRIRHPSVDPAELSRELGMQANSSFRAGDRRQSRSGHSAVSVHGESYWLGTLDPAASPAANWLSDFAHLQVVQKSHRKAVSQNLGWALSFHATHVLRTNAALFERIRNEGGQVSLLVALRAGEVDSFSLTPEVSRIFSHLAITIEFEMTGD
jgi:hypothetical protein